MFNKKIISISLMIILSLLITLLVVFNKSTNGNVQKTATYKNLEDLSIQQLTTLRDKDIDQNLEDLSNTFQNRKDGILNSDLGLVAFINQNYKDLTQKEKLIKQIKLIEYLNSINEIMDSAGDYFNVVNKDYELSEYLLENGRDSNTTSYQNLKFLINNLEDVSNSIDYDVKDILESIDPSIKTSLSQEQKSSLNNELKKISLDDNVN